MAIHTRTLQSVGNAQTGYELGSTYTEQLLALNAVVGSTSLDLKNFNTVVVQWTTTGSMSGSVLGGNDNSNWVVLSTVNLDGAQTSLVGFEGSALPRFLQVTVGSVDGGVVTGSAFCDLFAKA